MMPWPPMFNKQEQKKIDDFQKAVKVLPSFINFPSHCTPQQQAAVDLIYREINAARNYRQEAEEEQAKDTAPSPKPGA